VHFNTSNKKTNISGVDWQISGVHSNRSGSISNISGVQSNFCGVLSNYSEQKLQVREKQAKSLAHPFSFAIAQLIAQTFRNLLGSMKYSDERRVSK